MTKQWHHRLKKKRSPVVNYSRVQSPTTHDPCLVTFERFESADRPDRNWWINHWAWSCKERRHHGNRHWHYDKAVKTVENELKQLNLHLTPWTPPDVPPNSTTQIKLRQTQNDEIWSSDRIGSKGTFLTRRNLNKSDIYLWN